MCDEIMAFLFEDPEARVQQSGYFKVIPFLHMLLLLPRHMFFFNFLD